MHKNITIIVVGILCTQALGDDLATDINRVVYARSGEVTAALVRLNVATDAQQSTVELSIQRGVCPRPCSKRPGSCALAEADAELACNAVGRHPVPRD